MSVQSVNVEGYIIASAQPNEYLSSNKFWYDGYENINAAWVHPPEILEYLRENAAAWDVKPLLAYPAKYDTVEGGKVTGPAMFVWEREGVSDQQIISSDERIVFDRVIEAARNFVTAYDWRYYAPDHEQGQLQIVQSDKELAHARYRLEEQARLLVKLVGEG